MHAFKNYKCLTHDQFFGVDLYRASAPGSGGASSTYNYHHMRLNAFAHENQPLMEEFFRRAA